MSNFHVNELYRKYNISNKDISFIQNFLSSIQSTYKDVPENLYNKTFKSEK